MSGSNGGHGIGRPKVAPECRKEAVERIAAGERITDIAREYGVSRPAVRWWVKQAGMDITGADPAGEPRQCDRCGIATTRPALCRDCIDVTRDVA